MFVYATGAAMRSAVDFFFFASVEFSIFCRFVRFNTKITSTVQLRILFRSMHTHFQSKSRRKIFDHFNEANSFHLAAVWFCSIICAQLSSSHDDESQENFLPDRICVDHAAAGCCNLGACIVRKKWVHSEWGKCVWISRVSAYGVWVNGKWFFGDFGEQIKWNQIPLCVFILFYYIFFFKEKY